MSCAPPVRRRVNTDKTSAPVRAEPSAAPPPAHAGPPVDAPPRFFAALPAAVRARLAKLGIARAFDLVLHLPLRYEDETRITPIRDLPYGRAVSTEGEIVGNEIVYRPRRQLLCELSDGVALLSLRFLNFYPSQVKQLAVGRRVRAHGEVRSRQRGAEMVHPRYYVVERGAPLPEALTPVYPSVAGLSQAALRKLIEQGLGQCPLEDTLAPQRLAALGLPGFADSVRALHYPSPHTAQSELEARATPAWRRLKFDELLAQQLSMRLAYRERRRLRAPALAGAGGLTARLLGVLPFALTSAQRRAQREIAADLSSPHPMQRLLQGDVGSGKTIVAALACAQVIEHGFQAALMAPTEILAEQHFRKIQSLLTPLGVTTAWLAGRRKKVERESALSAVRDGSAQLVIGTQALFQQGVAFARLGLAVIDEQHRFGVDQRLALASKGADATGRPHQLMMSATPIPRTLSMTYYADLDVSVLDELPPGRTPVSTKLVAAGRREEVVRRVREACHEGAQAYWVCPLIEESESLQAKTAVQTFEAIRTTFPDLKVALVHGRLAARDKTAVMQAFEAGSIQLLVATTVIEVGVDVPNASLMVIENAERMGLAQLHQLRGRVGRGARASACILLYQTPLSEQARERLKVIYESHDGFEIARHDLRIRGPGEFLGAKQSGLPLLRFADLERDGDLIASARALAQELVERDDPTIERHLDRWLGGRVDYLNA